MQQRQPAPQQALAIHPPAHPPTVLVQQHQAPRYPPRPPAPQTTAVVKPPAPPPPSHIAPAKSAPPPPPPLNFVVATHALPCQQLPPPPPPQIASSAQPPRGQPPHSSGKIGAPPLPLSAPMCTATPPPPSYNPRLPDGRLIVFTVMCLYARSSVLLCLLSVMLGWFCLFCFFFFFYSRMPDGRLIVLVFLISFLLLHAVSRL